MRDKRFSETQPGRPRRQSHPPAPSSDQLSRPAFNADGAAIDATPARLRKEFGRCNDAERAQLHDMRIEKNRLAAIARSDRAMRRHIIAMARLERELGGVTYRLTARVHEKKKAVPTTRRKRIDMPPARRLPRLGMTIVDRAGRRGIFVEVTSVGANQPRYRPGCTRLHLNYIWAENAVERLPSGPLSRCSNMGETPEQVAAAMDLKEDVARASRANANIEIRIIVRLPHDISPEARFAILHQVCEDFFGRNGLPYAAAVHPPDPHSDDRNFHGHIQAGFRPMRHVGGNEWEVATELRTDLSRPEGIRLLRAVVADTMTEVSRKEGKQRTYTSLSNQERGLTLKPLKKVGREQTEAYRRGEYVGVVEENIRIIADNLRRYAAQRARWLKETLPAPRPPAIEAPSVSLKGPLPALPAPVERGDFVELRRENKPRRVIPPVPAHVLPGGAAYTPPHAGDRPTVIIPRPVLGSSNDDFRRAMPASHRPAGDAGRSILSGLDNLAPALVRARHSHPPLSTLPPRLPCLDISIEPAPTERRALPKVALAATPVPHAETSGIDDALVLFQLRIAQKKEREKLAARRRHLLDRHLFQRGDTREPTPDYAAFLLAIRDDPASLRWQLNAGGKRREPVVARGDQSFADRFAVYMQHPAVRRQVGELLEAAYAPGAPWPADLANGMWRYEAGRHGHRAATTARAVWVGDDARFRDMVDPARPANAVLELADGIVVPGVRHTSRLHDADLVRLLYPSIQRLLVTAYREEQEELVECLAAVANGTARIGRRLMAAANGLVRPLITPETVPPALAGAFLRWRDDADFYLDTGSDSAAAKAAVERKSRCADPHLRALRAARDAGDPPAVLRVLESRVAGSRSSAENANAAGNAPATPRTRRLASAPSPRGKGRPRSPRPRRS